MKNKQRLFGLLTSAAILTGMIPAGVVNTSADDIYIEEVSTMEEFKRAMITDRSCYIKLTKDISEKREKLDDGFGYYWLDLGFGTKEIDLNGHKIEVNDGSFEDIKSTMFMIPPQTTLVIHDEDDKGEIIYDAWMSANMDYSVERANVNRDIFCVNGGQLIINGGQITAGRAKHENVWTPYILYTDGLDGWEPVPTLWEISKYINGTAIELIDGKVTINGGCFTSRGFDYINTKKQRYTLGYDYNVTEEQGNMSNEELREAGLLYNTSERAFDRNAIIEAEGGTLTINDGNFYAKGNADCLNIADAKEAHIHAGHFQLHFNDTVLVDEDLAMYGSYGDLGIEPDYIDPNRSSVRIKDSKTAKYYKCNESEWYDESKKFLRADKRFDGADEPYIEIEPRSPELNERKFTYSGSVYYTNDPDQKLTISTGFDNYFTDSYCIPEGMHSYNRMWYLYDVKDSGKLYMVSQNNCKPYEVHDLNEPLLAELRKGIQAGHDYSMIIVDSENWEGTNSYTRSDSCMFTFRATDTRPIKITQQPADTADTFYNGKTTFKAKAENAKTARWYSTSPTNGIQPCGDIITLDESGEATVNVNADGSGYFCRFYNDLDSADTDTAYACYKPTFRLNESSKTVVKGEDAIITIGCDYDSEHPCDHILRDEWLEVIIGYRNVLTDSIKYDFNGNTLTIKNVTSDSNFGICRRIVTDHGTYTSPTVTISTVDGTPEKILTSFELKGIKDLYIGDKAPTYSEVSTTNENYYVQNVSWNGVDLQGYINSPNPSYTLTLVAFDGYSFKFDSNGDLRGTMEGTNLITYGSPDSLESTIRVTRTYDNHSPLTYPTDKAVLDQYDFTVDQFENVDIQLDPQLICPDQHKEKHSVKSMSISTYAPEYHLPEGLTMDNSGHITGMVTMEPGIQSFRVDVESTGGDISTLNCTFIVNEHKHNYIKVTDPETGEETLVCTLAGYCGAEPVPVPKTTHTHIWSAWKSENDDVHSRTCSECKETMTARHNYDDGVITEEATEEKNGTVVFTCTECGHKMTAEYEYDAVEYILGDVSGDKKINVTDITKAAAHVKGKKLLDAAARKRADTNGDGVINVTDVTKIAAHVKGKKLLTRKK